MIKLNDLNTKRKRACLNTAFVRQISSQLFPGYGSRLHAIKSWHVTFYVL